MKAISKAITVIFNPVLHLYYLLLFLIFGTEVFLPYLHNYKLGLLLGYLFLNSVFLPLFFIWILKRDLILPGKIKKVIPHLVTLAMYLIIYIFMGRFPFPPIILSYIFSLLSGLVLIVLLNLFFNISLYSASCGALISLFGFLLISDSYTFFYPFVVLLIISGFIGSSRIYLKSNSPLEVYSGYLLGFINTLIILLVRG